MKLLAITILLLSDYLLSVHTEQVLTNEEKQNGPENPKLIKWTGKWKPIQSKPNMRSTPDPNSFKTSLEMPGTNGQTTPDTGRQWPKIDLALPRYNSQANRENWKKPSIKFNIPNFTLKSQRTNKTLNSLQMQWPKFNLPKLELENLKRDVKIPKLDLSARSTLDLDLPKVNLPNIDLNLPKVELELPKFNIKAAQESAERILNRIRNGDWPKLQRETKKDKDEESENKNEEERIEAQGMETNSQDFSPSPNTTT